MCGRQVVAEMNCSKERYIESIRANRDIMYTLALFILHCEDAAAETVEKAAQQGYFSDEIPHRKAAFTPWILKYVYCEAVERRRCENFTISDAYLSYNKNLPQLGSALSALEPEICTAGTLYYYGNLNLPQIAAALDVPKTAAAAYLDSAREQLASLLTM